LFLSVESANDQCKQEARLVVWHRLTPFGSGFQFGLQALSGLASPAGAREAVTDGHFQIVQIETVGKCLEGISENIRILEWYSH
jgi:hypothetical protein